MSLKSLFTKKPVPLPAKPKEPEIRTLKEGREFPKEIKDLIVEASHPCEIIIQNHTDFAIRTHVEDNQTELILHIDAVLKPRSLKKVFLNEKRRSECHKVNGKRER